MGENGKPHFKEEFNHLDIMLFHQTAGHLEKLKGNEQTGIFYTIAQPSSAEREVHLV